MRSDNETKVCGVAGNAGRAWFSILPVSASRLIEQGRSDCFTLVTFCLALTDLPVLPQLKDAFQGAFLNQGPLKFY